MGGVVLDLAGICADRARALSLLAVKLVGKYALHYCCVALNVPGVSEKARQGARHHFRTLTMLRFTLWVVLVGPLHWAACLFGSPIPTGRPMALHLCLLMSTQFCLFCTSLRWFSSGYSGFPHHSNRL